ncbi:serine hydrolase [Larkinella rosea]|uniref:Serine hydrolase n=1 Tax=Larkinella rosea TaxID=2025312 RepID=A0A3P1BLX7_9BACT|nr:serine hydrolase [Larkinella rosea]RRB02041.1 serine hydrolase [Larkinella rosea]
MRSITCRLFLFVFFSTSSAFAQPLADSTERLVDNLFQKWVGNQTPGCAVGIVRGDQLVYAKGFGLANLENKVPITPNSLFYMCSVSKQFTGYAIALLVQAGKINLTDDCRRYLPWLADFGHPITVQHLLHHTSGLRDDISLAEFYGLNLDGVLTQELALQILKRQRTLNFVPGEKFAYSNSNYVLLAEIVKKASGMPFEAFADSAIFQPLRMSDSRFVTHSNELIAGRVSSYEPVNKGFKNATQTVYTLGDGGLFTNVIDMARWISNFFRPQVGDQQTIGLLTRPGRLATGQPLRYAMGINVDDYAGQKRFLHNGGLAGYRTIVAIYPQQQLGLMVFGNGANGEVYSTIDQLSALLMGKKTAVPPITQVAAPSPQPVEIDSVTLRRWTGDYIAADGYRLSITLKDERLYLNGSQALTPQSAQRFYLTNRPNVNYQFEVDPQGTPVGLQLNSPVLAKPMELAKIRQSALTTPILDTYTGDYYSDELDLRVRIVRQENELWLLSSRHPAARVSWIGGDHLYTDYGFMHHLLVKRDAKDQIVGFEVNSGELMHLPFHKQK